MIIDDTLPNLEQTDLSDKTVSASQLYAQSLMKDLLRQWRPGKHSVARAARAKTRIAKRKAKRKA